MRRERKEKERKLREQVERERKLKEQRAMEAEMERLDIFFRCCVFLYV